MSGRGKELKGQTLVIPGSRSGASTIVTELAYDSAFNLEYIGEARFRSSQSDLKWYIERLTYDSAFNLTRIQTAQNFRNLSPTGATQVGMVVTFPSSTDTFDIRVGDMINNIAVTNISENTLTLASPLPADAMGNLTDANLLVELLEYTNKDFNRRAWDLRTFYLYA